MHGAWTTPAVVVRRPDGSVVGDGGDKRRPRVRPRRIPGAPGAVLHRATLTPDADGRAALRPARRVAVPASPLPPRPAKRGRTDRDRDERGQDERGREEMAAASTSRPALRTVGGTASTPDDSGDGRRRTRGRRGPGAPDGARRRRAIDVVAGLNFDRLVPGDEEARQRRAARLRRTSVRLAAVAVVAFVIYGVFPVRTWIDQRAATDRARERLEVFERENELLASEKRDLSTDERIEEEAREMGFVLPGEESYGIYPAPDPTAPPSGTTSTTQPGG
ncbi:MAG TPA: septum formation initiator family protein [Acidimicrobiales bacterium]|nr:septum formation initiator family protein [Acidimicrobiales bacterium]